MILPMVIHTYKAKFYFILKVAYKKPLNVKRKIYFVHIHKILLNESIMISGKEANALN